MGSWRLMKFSSDTNLKGTWERKEQPCLAPMRHVGISPRFWEVWGFVQVSSIMILASKGLLDRMTWYFLHFRQEIHDLFWNSKTFPWCPSQINESENYRKLFQTSVGFLFKNLWQGSRAGREIRLVVCKASETQRWLCRRKPSSQGRNTT